MLIFFVIVHRLFLWKTKKALTNALQDILHGPRCKRNKICIDHGGKFCIKLMKTWLEGTIIEIYSMYEEICWCLWELEHNLQIWLQYQKNVLTEHLNNIVNKYTNAYQRIIKMKPDDFLLTWYGK